jgi:threonine/homoserine/homoserine lactone efflux protein
VSDVLEGLIPPVLGIALGPLPILAIVLMLRTAQPARTSIGFAVGWLAGVALATALLVSCAALIPAGDSAHPRRWLGVIQVALGVALLLWSSSKIVAHFQKGEPEPPRLFDALTSTTPARSVRVGATLATLNPKHFVFMLPVATLVTEQDLSRAEAALAVLLFALLASSTVLAPTLLHRWAPARVDRALDRVFRWLVRHMSLISAAVLALIGANSLFKGLDNL